MKHFKVILKDKKLQEYENCDIYEYKDFIIISTGQPYDINNNVLTSNEIFGLYKKHKDKIYKYIKGFFSIIVYDIKHNKIDIYQDIIGDYKPVYYFFDDNKTVLSSKIINILDFIPNRTINTNAVSHFLNCGFIPGIDTLINNLYKVRPFHVNTIDINNHTISLKKYRIEFKQQPKNDKKYIELLTNFIGRNVSDDKTCALTLSSGFDSNLLVSLTYNHFKKNIDLLCIGGVKGVNETYKAKYISLFYPEADFKSATVTNNTLLNFPTIVYLLEGLFYERGIFLQYELMKLSGNKNCQIFSGEGADEVLSKNFNKTQGVENNFHKKNFSLFKNNPYELLSYVILKKNAIMLMNSNNEFYYPYLDYDFIEYAQNYRDENGYNKSAHKRIVCKEVQKDIAKLLEKKGGSTDQESLYSENLTFEQLKKYALESKYNNIEHYSDTTELTNIADYVLKITYLEIFEKIFITGNYNFYNEKEIEKLSLLDVIKLEIDDIKTTKNFQ